MPTTARSSCRFEVPLRHLARAALRLLLLIASAVVFTEPGFSAEPRRLTTDGRLKSTPVFIDRSGTELIYVVQERPVQFRLVRLKLDDLTAVAVHPQETRTEFEPAASPDGRLMAFVQSRANLSLALVMRDTVSGKMSEVPPAGGFAGPRSPAIAADGKRVLYCFPDQGRQRIYSVDLDAGDRRTIVDSEGVNNWPDCSPDGRRIVWSSTRDDDYEIYDAAVDGSGVRRLTISPRQDIRPRYSPDGSRIAFMSARDGNYEIYVMRADGTDAQRATDHPESDDYPAWHPNGRELVVVSERDGRHDLYLIPAP